MAKILILCHGNICRSPMAEVILKDLLEQNNLDSLYQVESAGLTNYHQGENADPRTIKTLQDHNLPNPSQSRGVTDTDLTTSDYILIMDNSNELLLKNLQQQYGFDWAKVFFIHHFDQGENSEVEDPYYGDQEEFDQLYHELNQALTSFVEFLKKAQPN